MGFELSAWNGAGITALWAWKGAARARCTVSSQRISGEFAAAVWTATQTLGTVFGTVDGHATAEDAGAAFGFAVNWLLVAGAGMVFESLAGEFGSTEFAFGSALCTCELDVIGHHNTWYLGTAFVWA